MYTSPERTNSILLYSHEWSSHTEAVVVSNKNMYKLQKGKRRGHYTFFQSGGDIVDVRIICIPVVVVVVVKCCSSIGTILNTWYMYPFPYIHSRHFMAAFLLSVETYRNVFSRDIQQLKFPV